MIFFCCCFNTKLKNTMNFNKLKKQFEHEINAYNKLKYKKHWGTQTVRGQQMRNKGISNQKKKVANLKKEIESLCNEIEDNGKRTHIKDYIMYISPF